ncbi:golgin subfamily A member 1 [Thalassophryne amazonica]|uniref:golgin subfamily A member 1 n=1 Tax=Thalassophryne amazonica TaxID=390379 RepID=UPI0014717FA1|nr:golgin subfamily A member 1 [Thalassophryne amazonica]
MFAKLKKKIAEEAAIAPRSGIRIPRSISKESITSGGADSGDDFASDGSSSRDDLSAQLLRRNEQIRKLEAKLSDFAEQLRILQKTKDKLEVALEQHQDSSIKKLQVQNESHQASRAKLAEGMTLALEKRDQEWTEKMSSVEKENAALSARLQEMMEQSLTLFQKRDDLDELEGFQQQELAKVKHMLLRREEQLSQREAELQTCKRGLSEAEDKLQALSRLHDQTCTLHAELEIEHEELLLLRAEAEKKSGELDVRCRELQAVIQQVSEDFQQSQTLVGTLQRSLHHLQTERDALKLQQQKAAVTQEGMECLLVDLQKKVISLESRLQRNLSPDEHLQELFQEKLTLEQSVEETRTKLMALRANHAETVIPLEAQVSRMSLSIMELQTLLRHKDESSRAYRDRTDAQIATLEQEVQESSEHVRRAERQLTDKQQHSDKLEAAWRAEKAALDQELSQRAKHLEECVSTLQRDKRTLQDRLSALEQQKDEVISVLRQRMDELDQCKEELHRCHTLSAEMVKALDDSRRQVVVLGTQVGELTSALQTSQQEVTRITDQLTRRDEDLKTLHQELESQRASLGLLQKDFEWRQAQLEQTNMDKDAQLLSLRGELLSQTQQLDCCQGRISYLEVEVEMLTEQLHCPAVCEEDQNGSVTVDDLHHVQKVNRELELQLNDKNRTIKQLQQRLAELKRTLQKELKMKPEPDTEGKEKLPECRTDKQERVSPDPVPESMPAPLPANITVTNTSDISDSREINFEYLKHVVLKFMSSREAEAYQLIRAVSVLLNFTHEEEDMLKQTLEYKMSWFGSKPSPKGTIRPSVSGVH